ncbi:hypothetical protein QFZ41_000617 [Luteibacter sp. W1I16]|uniref:hypothetical protein n=1 Tax=Luteibacter sp. W1I16 TaxID=3373922 RepID=UPI003D2359DD
MDVMTVRAWRVLCCLLLAVLTACASAPPRLPSPLAPPSAASVLSRGAVAPQNTNDEEGRNMAVLFQGLYALTPADCGSGRPAFHCSGVLLRGGQYSTAFGVWNPNPNSPKVGGVSFSWLRQDARFGKLAYGYDAGFLFAPTDYQGAFPYYPIDVLCAYPIDANSDARSAFGCGANSRHPATSGPCQAQNITTSSAWLNHYRQVTDYPNAHQCGFTTKAGTADAAVVFALLPSAMSGLGSVSFQTQNELIVAEWPQNIVGTIPLAAFFYAGGGNGLPSAQGMQRDFIRAGGPWRPVLRMTLPANASAQASFDYLPGEQAVP